MEFLLTYGWAIVVVVTAIAALAYFGVLDVDKYAPSMCTLPAGLSCLDHGVSYDGNYNKLELRVKNNLGFKIKITGIAIEEYQRSMTGLEVTLPNGDATEEGDIDLTDMTNAEWPPPDYPPIPSGQKYDIEFKLTYTNTGSGLPHTVTGTITGKIN